MAANQSRRRTELASTSKPVLAEPLSPFPYQPFSPGVDELRLLFIEPLEGDNDTVVCRLQNVAFSSRPKYEALSYRWGDQSNEGCIVIDGYRVSVRQNLLHALHHLRGQARGVPIWIDALCINQEDVEERNRQLRIMHHVYTRASAVVVWLGQEYAKYENLMARPHGTVSSRIAGSGSDGATLNEHEDGLDGESLEKDHESGFVEDLNKDPYWERLWIVQEVATAISIDVCFGRSAVMKWDKLIHLMTMTNRGIDGALRLERLRQNVDNGALTLRSLLYDHQQAVCEVRHDKIYGIIGLAVDAYGFPMDYTKAPIDVWKDVMCFVNKKQLVNGPELIRFGSLVKFLLMDAACSPLQQILHLQKAQDNASTAPQCTETESVFKIRGAIVGQIIHVGPSTTAIVGELSKVDKWNEQVQVNFRDMVERTQRESRLLRHAIIASPDERTCFDHVSKVKWRGPPRYGGNSHIYNRFQARCNSVQELNTCASLSHPYVERTDPEPSAPHLVQWKKWGYSYFHSMLGIASSHAAMGDLIVWVADTKQAAVVRCEKDDDTLILQIVGTAWAAEDVYMSDVDHTSRIQSFENGERFEVLMDAETIFVLIS